MPLRQTFPMAVAPTTQAELTEGGIFHVFYLFMLLLLFIYAFTTFNVSTKSLIIFIGAKGKNLYTLDVTPANIIQVNWDNVA